MNRKVLKKEKVVIGLWLALLFFVLPMDKSNLGNIEAEAASTSISQTLPAKATNAPEAELLSAVKFVDMVSLHLGGAMLDDQGSVWMWGYNIYGVQALETVDAEGGIARYNGGMKRVDYFVRNNIEIVSIEGAYHNMYAIGIDHNNNDKVKVYSWGNGIYGAIGNGKISVVNSTPVEVKIPDNEEAVELYAGVETEHAVFARCKSGNVYGWGYGRFRALTTSMVTTKNSSNYSGYYVHTPTLITQLSDINKADPVVTDPSNPNYDPTAVPNNIVSMDIGTYHGILATKDGSVYTWGQGYNFYGQTGSGNSLDRLVPTKVDSLSNVVEVSASTLSSLVLTEDGSVYQFGYLYHMGYGGASYRSPVLVNIDKTSAEYIPKFQTIENGRYAQFATDQYGRMWSWGCNIFYQWATDGPMAGTTATTLGYDWTNPGKGKLNKILNVATQIPKTLGDGDVEEYHTGITGPVFTGYDPYVTTGYNTNKLSEFNDILNHWFNQGAWSTLNGAAVTRHPTIYDKKYYHTDKEPGKNLAIMSDGTVRTSAMNKLHSNVYFVDEQGRKLVYVVRKDTRKKSGTAASSFTYSGDFYVATDAYTNNSSNKWYFDMRGTKYDENSALPDGVTNETSVPAVLEEERSWIENATGESPINFTGTQHAEVPYIVSIESYQSNTLIMDSAGNTYRAAYDGSGTIAWGFDWEPAYDWAQMYHNYSRNTIGNKLTGLHYLHEVDGLFDMYNHELMYLRGSPRINPSSVEVETPTRKIYTTETDNTLKASVTVELGAATSSESMNLFVEPELSEALYVKIPYDESDPRMNQTDVTQAEFMAAYNAAGAADKGNLLELNQDSNSSNPWNNPKNTSTNSKKILEDKDNIVVGENCVLWVMTVVSGYSADSVNIAVQKYDNFYTGTTLYHRGYYEEENIEVYGATDAYIEKTSSLIPDEDPTEYGLPLDKDGDVITNPTYGYDEVTIRAFEIGDAEFDAYIKYKYILQDNQSPVKYTLDSSDYAAAENFTHTFLYDPEPR